MRVHYLIDEETKVKNEDFLFPILEFTLHNFASHCWVGCALRPYSILIPHEWEKPRILLCKF